MIDFIISKLGILIFAVTMAGILLYFSASIKDVFLSDETIQVSNIMAKQIKYMAESDNLCSSTKVILPKYIDILGVSDSATFSSVYYNLEITKQQSGENYFVIFSITNKQTGKQIALESFMTRSDVILYDNEKGTVDSLLIDPTYKQVVYMVKNESNLDNNPQTNIYFVNCRYNRDVLGTATDAFDDCYKQLQNLKDNSNMIEYPFFCVPTSAPIPSLGSN